MYIERERDRERDMNMCIYIYIYIYTHVYIGKFVPDVGLPTLDDFSERKDEHYTRLNYSIPSYNTL